MILTNNSKGMKMPEINYTELHVLCATEPYGTKIYIRSDGSFFTLGPGSRPHYDAYILEMTASGPGNVDRSEYAEGWSISTPDGWEVIETGEILSDVEMITRAIRDGDPTYWEKIYAYWRDCFEYQLKF